jgi:hypothetical protein
MTADPVLTGFASSSDAGYGPPPVLVQGNPAVRAIVVRGVLRETYETGRTPMAGEKE